MHDSGNTKHQGALPPVGEILTVQQACSNHIHPFHPLVKHRHPHPLTGSDGNPLVPLSTVIDPTDANYGCLLVLLLYDSNYIRMYESEDGSLLPKIS